MCDNMAFVAEDIVGICEHTPIDDLLLLLAAVLTGHLEPENEDRFYWVIKTRMIQQAEKLPPNDYIEILPVDGSDGLLARVGKDEAGDIILWHKGLPWPQCWGSYNAASI